MSSYNLNDVKHKKLVVYKNDNYDFFETSEIIWIVTGYDHIQCEQLAIILLTKGYVTIKTDEINILLPMAEALNLEKLETLLL